MKVKNYWKEYDSFKTEKQWNDLGKKLSKEAKGVELWSNQFCNSTFYYFSPNEVIDMSVQEYSDYKKIVQKEKYLRHKELKAIKEKREKEQQEIEDELRKRREEWHTAFQWNRENRRVKEDAEWVWGSKLNYSPDSRSPFSPDYTYYHISDTELFNTEEEKERELNRLLDNLEDSKINRSKKNHEERIRQLEKKGYKSERSYFTAYELLDRNIRIKDFQYYTQGKYLNIHPEDVAPYEPNTIYFLLDKFNTTGITELNDKEQEKIRIEDALAEIEMAIEKREKSKVTIEDDFVSYEFYLFLGGEFGDYYWVDKRYTVSDLEIILKIVEWVQMSKKEINLYDAYAKIILKIEKVIKTIHQEIQVDDLREFLFTNEELELLRNALKNKYSDLTDAILNEKDIDKAEKLREDRMNCQSIKSKISEHIQNQMNNIIK